MLDLDLPGKRVLMRVDFNVPLDSEGRITDDTRIEASLASIRYVLEHGASLVLMSHLGRPKGKTPELSLAPCAARLSELLGINVTLAPDSVGLQVEELANNLQPGEVLLLENLRFHPGEEAPDKEPDFVKNLAKLGDYYVNDAFGTAHRAHASTAHITQFFPGRAASGFLLDKEIEFLGSTFKDPQKPFYAIIGGAKISSKIGVLKALLNKVNALLIGGGMAYTFFKAQGYSIGNSICEDEYIPAAKELLEQAKAKGVKLLLPIDNVVADRPQNGAKTLIVESSKGIPDGYQGVDIGPQTIHLFRQQIQDAATLFWNGPLGIFEQSEFAKGTQAIALAVAQMDATTIVGGGDSVAAIDAAGVGEKITHLSTGGGASIEYIEFGKLPGIDALSDK